MTQHPFKILFKLELERFKNSPINASFLTENKGNSDAELDYVILESMLRTHMEHLFNIHNLVEVQRIKLVEVAIAMIKKKRRKKNRI